jgi:hypothetical protein
MKHKTATQTVGAPGVFKLLPEVVSSREWRIFNNRAELGTDQSGLAAN